MNLNNFETQILRIIFERGKDYYLDNTVTDLQGMENGQWFAIVEGNDDYEVDIKIGEKGEILNYDCSCPYDGQICKHIVAVLLEIKGKEAKTATTDQQANKETGWKEIINTVPEKELRRFIMEYAAKNKEF